MTVRDRLERAPVLTFAAYAVVAAFVTYFCMYAYRKPFAAANYTGQTLGPLSLKDALVIGQLVGYALSKLVGIRINSEMPHHRRTLALVLLIAWAEAALILFAVTPAEGQVVAMFLNGLPLGAVWGLVFSFLEGRQSSEILGAGLSCSYIIASGAVRGVGKWLLSEGVSESWMPAAVGALFAPLFLLAVWALAQLPAPSAKDVAERTHREPMRRPDRARFLRQNWPGLLALVLVYLFLTAYRDFRDNFQTNIFAEMGVNRASNLVTTEMIIGLSVMVVLSLLFLVKSNRRGLALTYVIMAAGSVLVGLSTLLYDLGVLDGLTWMTLVGLGLYLGYVPYGCVLFDRTIAALGTVATAVFLIYVSDAVAYGGSVGIVLYKTLGQAELPYLDFFRVFSYATFAVTGVCLVLAAGYFLGKAPSKPS